MTSSRCTGRGPDGSHCCYIDGEVCPALVEVRGFTRCSLRLELGSWEKVHQDPRWKALPVGEFFDETYPGFGCGDWPQNIPEVMAEDSGRCCYDRPPEVEESTLDEN